MTNKKKSVLFGVTALIATTVTGVTVKADNNENTSNNVVSTEVHKVKNPAQSVKEAEANYDSAQQAVTDATKAKESAQTDVDSAKTALDQATEIKDQATPEAIAQAKDAVDHATQVKNEAQSVVDSAQTAVDQSQQDVDAKKSALDEANTQVGTTKTAYDQATKDAEKAQTAVDTQAQAKKDASALEEQQTKDKQVVTEATKAVTEATNQKQQADQNLSDAKANKDKVDTAITEKTDAVNNAQTAVDNATKALDTTGAAKELDKKQANYDTIYDQVEQAKTAVKEATTTKDQATASLDTAKSALDQATTAKQNAQNTFDQAKKATDTAKTTLDQAKQALVNAQNQASDSDIENSFEIVINEDFKKAVQKYTSDLYNNADDKTLNADFQAMKDNFSYDGIKVTTNLPDKYNYVIINNDNAYTMQQVTNNLNKEEILIIEKYKTAFINKLRDTLGISQYTGHVFLNQDTIDLANYLSYSGNTEDINPNQKNPKMEQFKQEMATKYGLNQATINQTISPTQNTEYLTITPEKRITFSDIIKRTLTESTNGFNEGLNPTYDFYDRNGNPIYTNDKVYTFSKSVLGITKWEKTANQQAQNQDQKGQYFGYWSANFPANMRLNSQKAGENDLGIRDQYFFIPKTTVANDDKFNKTIIPVSNQTATTDTNALQSAVNNAQNAFDQANAKLTQNQSALDQANTDFTQAQNAYTKAQNDLTQATNNLDTKNKTLSEKQTALTNANQELDTAKANYLASLQDRTQKEANLKQAQTDLDQAKEALAKITALKDKIYAEYQTAQTNQDKANNQLAEKQALLTKAQKQLTKTNEALAKAKELADKNPAELQELLKLALEKQATAGINYDNTVANQKQAQIAYDKAVEKLAELQQTLGVVKDKLSKATGEYDSAKKHYEALFNADEDLKNAKTKYEVALANYNEALKELTLAQVNMEKTATALEKAKNEQLAILNFEQAYRDAQKENPTHNVATKNTAFVPQNVELNDTGSLVKESPIELPQMGEEKQSLFTILGMSLLTMLGAVGIRKSKRSSK